MRRIFLFCYIALGLSTLGCSQSEQSTKVVDREKIAFDCGTTKAQTEEWFATHKTGWAEHVEAGLKCIHDHQ